MEDDNEWLEALEQAALFRMPSELRNLFATILCHSFPSEPRRLWDASFFYLSEDFRNQYIRTVDDPLIIAYVAVSIENILLVNIIIYYKFLF